MHRNLNRIKALEAVLAARATVTAGPEEGLKRLGQYLEETKDPEGLRLWEDFGRLYDQFQTSNKTLGYDHFETQKLEMQTIVALQDLVLFDEAVFGRK
jgi:hypothetical protein